MVDPRLNKQDPRLRTADQRLKTQVRDTTTEQAQSLQREREIQTNQPQIIETQNKINSQINFYENQINQLKTEPLRDKSLRTRTIRDNRIKGRLAAIKFLKDQLNQGVVDFTNIKKTAENIRLGKTKELRQERLRKAGVTATKRETLRKAPTSKPIDTVRDTIKVAGKVYTGFTDKKSGEFIPDVGKEKEFQELKRTFGTTKTKEIREVLKRPEVQEQLKEIKGELRKFELAKTQQKVAEAKVRTELKKIDANPKLNIFEKERLKREMFGIPTSETGAQNFKLFKTESIKDTQLKNTIRTLENKKIDQRVTTKTLNKIENLRSNAIKGNQNAKAALFGLAALPVAAVDVGVDVVVGISNVIKNPVAVATAVSNLTVSDIQRGGTDFGARIVKGDPKALAELGVMITPVKVPVVDKFMAKIARDINKIQSADSVFKFEQNLVKGSGKIDIKTKGINQANQEFTSNIKLTIRPKDKTIFGTVETTIKGKTIKQNINLKDEGAFYVDKRTGIKIPKSTKALDRVEVRTKQISAKLTESQSRISNNFSGTIGMGKRTVKETKLFIEKGKKTELVREKGFDIEQALGVDAQGKKIVEVAATKRIPETIKGSFKKAPNKRSKIDWDRINKWLEFAQYDKALINGVDKRTRLAFALGINKKSAQKLIEGIERDIASGYIIIRTGKVRATGKFETINPSKFMLGPSFAFKNPQFLSKAKRTNKGKLEVPQEIKIPDINSPIFMPRKLPKGVRIPKGFLSIASRLGLARDYDFQGLTNTQKIKQLEQLKPLKKIPAKIKVPTKVKIPLKKVKQIKKVPSKVKKITKPVTKVKAPRVPKRIVRPTPPKPKVRKVPKIKPTLKVTGVNREVVVYQGIYRERKNRNKPANKKTNPVIVKKINITDTPNRALKRVADLADKRAIRSIDIKKVKGTGKIVKDIIKPKVLDKFTTKRPSSNVLKLVEKAKYSLDNPAERRDVKKKRGKKKNGNKK